MFRFIQYVERQIVLFDAIEDAAFPIVNNLEGRGSLRDIKEKTEAKDKRNELIDFLEILVDLKFFKEFFHSAFNHFIHNGLWLSRLQSFRLEHRSFFINN